MTITHSKDSTTPRKRKKDKDRDKDQDRIKDSRAATLVSRSSILDASQSYPDTLSSQSHSHSHLHLQASTDSHAQEPLHPDIPGTTRSASLRGPSLDTHDIAHYLSRSLQYIIHYLWDLALGTLTILRPIFSFLLALIVILWLIGAITRSLVVLRSEFHARIICNIPGVSHFVDCSSDAGAAAGSNRPYGNNILAHVPDFAELVNKQMASYELLADTMSSLHPDPIAKLKKKTKRLRRFGRNGKSTNTNSQGQGGDVGDDDDEEDDIDPYALTVLSPKDGVPLPLVLKHAELAVVDLKILVKHSSLPGDRKELLVELLEKFHVGAKATTRKLQFLQARANGCVDGLVIRNVYLIAELDRLEEQQQRWVLKDGSGNSGDGERGSIVGSVAAMWDRVWDLFTGEHELQILASEQKLQFLYQRTMEDARKHIRDLIVQAQDVLQSLDALDQAMASIHETTTQEKRAQSSGHEEILSLLWSRLGGNRLQRSFFRDNLRLLKDIGLQRKVAVGQIQSALLKLTEFEAEIGILRERVVDATVDITVDPGEGPHTVTAPSPNTGTPGQYDDNESMSGDAMPTDRALPGVSGMGASTLRSHILEINRATRRMKERSFLADTVLKSEQADQIPAGAKPDDASSP